MTHKQPTLDLSPKVSDEIRKTTCYMCACRCSINVHMKKDPLGDLKVAYIEGNRDHPVNKGVLCAKGSAELGMARKGWAIRNAPDHVDRERQTEMRCNRCETVVRIGQELLAINRTNSVLSERAN